MKVLFLPEVNKNKRKTEKNIIFEKNYTWKTKKTKTVRSAIFKKSKTILTFGPGVFFLHNLINQR
jgi:hypothetical protein